METLNRTGAMWGCRATCPNCRTACPIDWGQVPRSDQGDYDMQCPVCRYVFNFLCWQYASACPGCGREFTAEVGPSADDLFTYQRQCDGCGRMIEFKKDSAPQLRPDCALQSSCLKP